MDDQTVTGDAFLIQSFIVVAGDDGSCEAWRTMFFVKSFELSIVGHRLVKQVSSNNQQFNLVFPTLLEDICQRLETFRISGLGSEVIICCKSDFQGEHCSFKGCLTFILLHILC